MVSEMSEMQQQHCCQLIPCLPHVTQENTLPRWIRTAAWYPRFVHVLKFHPAAQYEVNLHSVWSGLGLMESNLLTAQQETRLCVDEIEDKVSRGRCCNKGNGMPVVRPCILFKLFNSYMALHIGAACAVEV